MNALRAATLWQGSRPYIGCAPCGAHSKLQALQSADAGGAVSACDCIGGTACNSYVDNKAFDAFGRAGCSATWHGGASGSAAAGSGTATSAGAPCHCEQPNSCG